MAYSTQWRRFRLTTRFGVIAILVVPVALAIAIWIGGSTAPQALSTSFFAAAVVAFLVAMGLTAYQSYLRCPRCGRFFFRSSWAAPALGIGRRCVNCHLKLYHDA